MTLLLIFSCCLKYIFFAVDMSGILQILINFIIPYNILILCNTLNQMTIVMLDQSKLHIGSLAIPFYLPLTQLQQKRCFLESFDESQMPCLNPLLQNNVTFDANQSDFMFRYTTIFLIIRNLIIY